MASGQLDSLLDDITHELRDLTVSIKSTGELAGKPVGEDLGKGAYGRVYSVNYDGLKCAAKEVHPLLLELGTREDQQSMKERFLVECQHCNVLRHPKVVRFLGIFYPPNNSFGIPSMVMEMMDESLCDYIENLEENLTNSTSHELVRKGSILLDVAEGLCYLHAQSPAVIHRDLSPKNILLKRGKAGEVLMAKIADLGVARIVQVDNTNTRMKLTKAPGTVHFMPPESLKENPKYGTSLDVFSYGAIMLFIGSHKWPTPTEQVESDPDTDELRAYSEVQRRQKYLDSMPEETRVLWPLVKSCLNNKPAARPTMEVVFRTIKESPPLVPALQSGDYKLIWKSLAPLPFPLYEASVAMHDDKIYVMAGSAPEKETLKQVYCYDISINKWEQLPPPAHCVGRLLMVDGRLTVFGGVDNVTNKVTNKVSTLIGNSWNAHYPNMLKARYKPGVALHAEYVIVLGGRDSVSFFDDIELLNWTNHSQLIQVSSLLPKKMWNISPIISRNTLYIVGYNDPSGFRCSLAYQIPVDAIITPTTNLPPTSDEWINLPSAPYSDTALLPNSCPPIIIGGSNEGVPKADVAVLDVSVKKWVTVALLSSPRQCVAAVSINAESIIVLGGCSGGRDAAEAKRKSLTTVETGKAKPTQSSYINNSRCIIQ